MTTATTAATCAACPDPIVPGERVQRGLHWRCYMRAYRRRATRGYPAQRLGRPTTLRARHAQALALLREAGPWLPPAMQQAARVLIEEEDAR